MLHSVYILLVAFIPTVAASPESVDQFVQSALHPTNGNGTLSQQLTCYALPYGAMGVLSHVLTYYTTLCIGFGLRPLMPWKWMEHKKRDAALCLVSMVCTVSIAAMTMHSCRDSWALVLMALWKLVLSFSYNLVCAWRALTLERKPNPPHRLSQYEQVFGQSHTEYNPSVVYQMGPGPKKYYPVVQAAEVEEECLAEGPLDRISRHLEKRKSPRPLLGMIPYALTTLVGMVGLFDIVHSTFHTNHDIRLLTYALIGALVLLMTTVVFLCTACCGCHLVALCVTVPVGALASLAVLVAVLVFYSDLVVAAIEGDWVGVPDSENQPVQVAYWIYYIAKRLPMLSW